MLLLPCSYLQAATIYLEPEKAQYDYGDTFTMDIKLDVDGDCVNTVEAGIVFPKDLMQVKDFSNGESILSFWIDDPATGDKKGINDQGILHFIGGIPGGYCGKIPGDPGISNVLGKIIFYIPSLTADKNERIAKITFNDETKVLLNDGFGTEDKLSLKDSEIVISDKQILKKDEWSSLVKGDIIQPEPFIVELQHDPQKIIFDGDNYIIFNTTDKQTGVDHYMVLELQAGDVVGEKTKLSWWEKLIGRKEFIPDWKNAASPYRLEDQSLRSTIKVKALDKAGNERIVEYIPLKSAQKAGKTTLYAGIAAITVVLVAVSLVVIFRKKKNFDK